MSSTNFSYSFTSPQSIVVVFQELLNVRKWWSGVYNETIEGKSASLNDEFSFSAGGGAHFSKQKLTELIPNKKITWLVTESNLSFLAKKDEWTNTQFGFDLSEENGKTKIKFTHFGLQPEIECYDACSNGWMQYLKKLEQKIS